MSDYVSTLFLVGAFHQNEPDYYSGKFFSFFFVRPQNVCVDTFSTELLNYWTGKPKPSKLVQRVPPFMYSIFNVRYKTRRDYRVTPLNFFRQCACDFFLKLFLSPKGPPSSFLIFCSKLKFQKAQRVIPF